MRRALICLLLVAAACSANPPEAQRTYVMVTGPRDWTPPEDLVLEANASAWSITETEGGGVMSFTNDRAVNVRLVGTPSCRSYASFEADPGSAYIIRFGEGDSVVVEEAPGGGVEAGPALGQGRPSGCP